MPPSPDHSPSRVVQMCVKPCKSGPGRLYDNTYLTTVLAGSRHVGLPPLSTYPELSTRHDRAEDYSKPAGQLPWVVTQSMHSLQGTSP